MQALPCRPRLMRATRESYIMPFPVCGCHGNADSAAWYSDHSHQPGWGVADKCGRGMNPQHRRRHFHPQTGKSAILVF